MYFGEGKKTERRGQATYFNPVEKMNVYAEAITKEKTQQSKFTGGEYSINPFSSKFDMKVSANDN